MTTLEYSSKEPPQYTQQDSGSARVGDLHRNHHQQESEDQQLPAYTQRPNEVHPSSSASSISDQESDIILNYPENRVKRNECSVCCQDLFCGGCFGCCTGSANMTSTDQNLMGTLMVALCCGAGVQAGVS